MPVLVIFNSKMSSNSIIIIRQNDGGPERNTCFCFLCVFWIHRERFLLVHMQRAFAKRTLPSPTPIERKEILARLYAYPSRDTSRGILAQRLQIEY
jgi:hypothetical protein